MRPIVFIHGFGGGAYEFQPIIKYLRGKGFSEFHYFTYRERFGQLRIRELADRLACFVKMINCDFDIIGISQGGIIARCYITSVKNHRVRRCMTLCTPHKGSLIAYLSSRPGAKDLRPGSPLLTSLKDRDVKYFAVHTPFDLMVLPGTNAMQKGARNKRVYSLLHPLAFWCRQTKEFIADSLK